MNLGLWIAAFLGYPLGGLLATTIIGRVETPLQAALGGLIAGAVIGGLQALVLRNGLRKLPRNAGGLSAPDNLSVLLWIAATAAGLAGGVGLSVALIGAETTLEAILLRAVVTGLILGAGQALVLMRLSGRGILWLPIVAVLYVIAWFVTSQVIGASVDQGFVVFGASGALVYQLLTGLALRYAVRLSD